jgi:hypothetical protein
LAYYFFEEATIMQQQQFKLPSIPPDEQGETYQFLQNDQPATDPEMQAIQKQSKPRWSGAQRPTWQSELPRQVPKYYSSLAERKKFDIEKITGRIHLIVYGVLAVVFIVSILLTSLWRIIGAIASLKLV